MYRTKKMYRKSKNLYTSFSTREFDEEAGLLSDDTSTTSGVPFLQQFHHNQTHLYKNK